MAPYDPMSDEELMILYYACDDRAFAELFNRYNVRLALWALGKLNFYGKPKAGRRQTAEDLTADTWVRVTETKYRPSCRWQPPRPVRPWLWTVHGNSVREYLRREHSLEIPESCFVVPDDPDSWNFLEVAAAKYERCAQRLDEAVSGALRECVEELPDLERLVNQLIHFEGLRQTDVAKILGVADSTVLTIRLKAYARLATCLRRKKMID